MVPKIRVDGVIRENGRICGIRAAGDEIGANVVIAADGVNSLLSEKAGLRARHDPAHFAVAAKEIIELSGGVIEERFQLERGEGAAQLFAGSVTRGMPGGGFLYTNRETLSLGVVVGVQAAGSAGVPIHELIEEFKEHPAVAPLVRGGNVVEYSAHLIPEAGPGAGTPLSADGFLTVGDAAGFCLNLGVTVRGMDYALASGVLAGQAALAAHQQGDFSRQTLSAYDRSVQESFIGKDFKSYRQVPSFLANPRLYTLYPRALTGAFKDLYRVTENSKGKILRGFRNSLFSRIPLGQALGDVIRGYRAL
ncbi:MAG: FAD-dependent oxidoreductase [Candidatus Tectomicrobia bacterium]|uniref:FAD-dependent oxidoreductase n=1 Tax=Tectimicrobiota bacterium TaxID=2528274 RepID=A0A932M1C7_UNCTE|nr:FAD-dependent oxidoreductase [Candidatus Tectomicrobia bacterium]